METVRVNLKDRAYNIHIGKGILSKLGAFLKDIFPSGLRVLIIADNNTLPLFGEQVFEALQGAGFKPSLFQVPVGEKAKELKQVEIVTSAALKHQMGREDFMLALGGGAVGDLTGFCAASYMRGVPYVQVPTTLLAQVDSSVGGKVAVNHPAGKNLLGFFHQPRLVVTDIDTLKSLPEREFNSGVMEVIKYGVISDATLFAFLEQKFSSGGKFLPEDLQKIILNSCRRKRDIVLQDEKEAGPRMVLNFGHTFGHALEKVTEYKYYLHGEAVGIGMIWSSRLAVKMSLLGPTQGKRIEELIKKVGFPALPAGIGVAEIETAMQHDKKKRQGSIPLILSRDIGRVEIVSSISPSLIRRGIEEIIAEF